MKSINLIKKFSEYQQVFSVGTHNDNVEIIVSLEMARHILEALRVYEQIDTALKEFGKKIKTW